MDVEQWSSLATRVLAPNPGSMTLDGTNTYVVRAPGSSAVIVDPGPEISAHLDRIEALGPVELILLTHHHSDHAESIDAMVARTGAPVRAADATLCRGAEPLRDGEMIRAGETRIAVLATPGHTIDSLCFHLPEDGAAGADAPVGSILTGDTILGSGTTVLTQPDGALRDYIRSLERLRSLPDSTIVLPAHGPSLPSLAVVAGRYLGHRRMRLAQVREALAELDVDASVEPEVVARVTDIVYPQIDPAIRFAAEASTAAQLEYLADA
ncbi:MULTISPECIES: MBL fold metallo-hydrolase [unclassified Microbacterium]|uniref:MBL fold metallo-hydrolase n=1 Tax=unclassified Microbacterium TaxID=2609290 RepID=UPI003465C88E